MSDLTADFVFRFPCIFCQSQEAGSQVLVALFGRFTCLHTLGDSCTICFPGHCQITRVKVIDHTHQCGLAGLELLRRRWKQGDWRLRCGLTCRVKKEKFRRNLGFPIEILEVVLAWPKFNDYIWMEYRKWGIHFFHILPVYLGIKYSTFVPHFTGFWPSTQTPNLYVLDLVSSLLFIDVYRPSVPLWGQFWWKTSAQTKLYS